MTLSYGPKLGLLIDGEQGEEHYEALMKQWRGLDALVQCTAISHTLGSSPASPSDGDVYLLPEAPVGDWSANPFHVARWSAKMSEWEFYEPRNGWIAWSDEFAGHLKFITGSGWVDIDSDIVPPVDEPDPLAKYQGAYNGVDLSLDEKTIVSMDSGVVGGAALGYKTLYTAKVYVEFVLHAMSTDTLVIGFIDKLTTKAAVIDGSAWLGSSWFNSSMKSMHVSADGTAYINGADIGAVDGFAVDDRIGVAIDFALSKAWVTKNGVAVDGGDPATGTNGFDVSAITMPLPFVGVNEVGEFQVEIVPLEADQLHTPSGYTGWIAGGPPIG